DCSVTPVVRRGTAACGFPPAQRLPCDCFAQRASRFFGTPGIRSVRRRPYCFPGGLSIWIFGLCGREFHCHVRSYIDAVVAPVAVATLVASHMVAVYACRRRRLRRTMAKKYTTPGDDEHGNDTAN